MTTHSDITLIGAGIMGLLTARECCLAGASVTLIDKNGFGKESSWAGGGILLPLYPWRQSAAVNDLVLQSHRLYPNICRQLADETGIDPELYFSGLLITQNPDAQSAIAWCNQHKLSFQEADPTLLHNLETQTDHPLLLPTIGQIRNPRLIKALKQDLLHKGVRLLENCQLDAIQLDAKRVDRIDTNLGAFAVNQLVMTAGAWTSQLIDRFFPSIRAHKPCITPIKGQMLLYAAEPDTLSTMVLDGDHYLIPRLDGHILAGSTVESDSTFDKSPTPEGKSELGEFALRLLPALQNYPLVNHWSGLRPGTVNGIPYIDRHPEIENLSINAGHFRNGLAMAPASARLLADLILDRPLSIDPEPYRLNRLN
jgi:glycine oxidase